MCSLLVAYGRMGEEKALQSLSSPPLNKLEVSPSKISLSLSFSLSGHGTKGGKFQIMMRRTSSLESLAQVRYEKMEESEIFV